MFPCQIINRRWGRIAEIIDNEGNGWKKYQLINKFNDQLGKALTEARYRRLIDWKLIIDNRNPRIRHDWDQENQEITHNYTIDDGFYINIREAPTNQDLKLKSWNIPDSPLKRFYLSIYDHTSKGIKDFEYSDYLDNFKSDISISKGKNNLNMYYIAFAIEKTTLERQFNELCRIYAIDFFPGQGFASTTRIMEICEKAEEIKKPLLILYLADLDKQGEAMTDSMFININRAYNHPYNEVIRIGINEDQVIKYNLPRESIEGKRKTELDALDSNDMLQIVEDSFIKYTIYARKSREIRNNWIEMMGKRMENISSVIESSEFEDYKEDMENWIEEYNKLKKKEREFKKRFTKQIWIPIEKKIQETIDKYHEYIDSFNELKLDNPNSDTLEDLQTNIKNEFSRLFDNYIKKFHIEELP